MVRSLQFIQIIQRWFLTLANWKISMLNRQLIEQNGSSTRAYIPATLSIYTAYMSIWYPLYHPSSLEPGKLLATEPPECVYIYNVCMYEYIYIMYIYIYYIYNTYNIQSFGIWIYCHWKSWGRFNPLLSAKFRPKWFCPRPFVAPQKVSASFSHLGAVVAIGDVDGKMTGKWWESDGKMRKWWENGHRKIIFPTIFQSLFLSPNRKIMKNPKENPMTLIFFGPP